MKNFVTAALMMAAMAAMSSAHATKIVFDVNETDPANPTPHVHHVALNFSFDPTYGIGGVDSNGFSLIDYRTLTGIFTTPLPGNVDQPYLVLDVEGLAPGAFQGNPLQFNDNLFQNTPGKYFTGYGLAFRSLDGTHSYSIYEVDGDLYGCAPQCSTGRLVVPFFAVPEPSSAALAVIGLLGFRKRAQCRTAVG